MIWYCRGLIKPQSSSMYVVIRGSVADACGMLGLWQHDAWKYPVKAGGKEGKKKKGAAGPERVEIQDIATSYLDNARKMVGAGPARHQLAALLGASCSIQDK